MKTKRRRSSSTIEAPAAAESTKTSGGTAVFLGSWLLFALMVVVVAARPIAADDFWWDLSRGREVFRGTCTPSRMLLSLDSAPEADWLGGVLLFLVYSLSGSTGLMVLRVAAAVALALFIHRCARGLPIAIANVIAFTGLIGAERAFDLGPRMFDVCGVVAAYWLAKSLNGATSLRRLIPLILLFIAWSNLGPRVVVGWIVLASGLSLSRRTERRFSTVLILFIAAVAMCVTPRGVMTVRDSLVVVVPHLATASWALEDTPWEPLSWSAWNASEFAYIGLSCTLIALLVVTPGRRDLRLAPAYCTVLMLPWISAGNLELASIWSVLLIVELLRESGLMRTDAAEPPGRTATALRSPAAAAALAVCILVIAWGGPRAMMAEMGWGLHSKLDNRLLGLALNSIEPHGTAFAENVHCAGMLCWLAPVNLQLQDVPQRAVLHGRWCQQRLILADLQREKQNSYLRDDGSQGGWWIPLRERDTSLVVIDVDNTTAIRGLEPSLWKPLSLDSTAIPYAAAGDPACNDRVIEVLQQRELVNVGSWTYSPPRSTNSEFDRDRWGLRDEIDDPTAALRQARVFRAMQLPWAALKVLHALPDRRWANTAEQLEFALCQMELAYAEAVSAGRPSRFRGLVLRRALRESYPAAEVDFHLVAGLDPPGQLSEAIAHYDSGDFFKARQVLMQGPAESRYAAACIAIETGQAADAIAILRDTAGTGPSGAVALLIAARRDEVEGYE